jgi:hypothetical protein
MIHPTTAPAMAINTDMINNIYNSPASTAYVPLSILNYKKIQNDDYICVRYRFLLASIVSYHIPHATSKRIRDS